MQVSYLASTWLLMDRAGIGTIHQLKVGMDERLLCGICYRL
jgi:hypothetical protein